MPALNDVREEKKFILCFVVYFALLVDEFGCGYARFQGAARAFSNHQKHRKKIDKSLRNLIFCARTWENFGKYMDFD